MINQTCRCSNHIWFNLDESNNILNLVMPYTPYLERFVAFSIAQLQQHPAFETFKENLTEEARAIINAASAQHDLIELRKLEHYLQTEIKYQLLQYRKRYVTVAARD